MSDGHIGSRDSFELSNGNLVVYWSQNMPNVPRSDGTSSSDYLFARVINPETGEFVSEELLLSDTKSHKYWGGDSSDRCKHTRDLRWWICA